MSAQVSLHKSCHLCQDSLAPKGADNNYQHLLPEDTSAETGGGQSRGSGQFSVQLPQVLSGPLPDYQLRRAGTPQAGHGGEGPGPPVAGVLFLQ